MVYIIAEVAATDRYQGARGVSLLAPQCYLNTPSIFIGSEINNLEEIFCSGFFPVVFYVLRLVSSICNYSCDITSILQHPFQTVTQFHH